MKTILKHSPERGTDEIAIVFDDGLTVTATKCAEDQWGTEEASPNVAFHFGRENFSEMTGLGFFQTIARVKLALELISADLGPAWVCNTECPKRQRAYSRYLPKNRILNQ